jgi:hypothetical protein
LLPGPAQQVFSNLLQCFEFVVSDVGPLVLLEPEDEKPSITLVGRNQGPGTATFTATGKPNPLLHDATTKVGIN